MNRGLTSKKMLQNRGWVSNTVTMLVKLTLLLKVLCLQLKPYINQVEICLFSKKNPPQSLLSKHVKGRKIIKFNQMGMLHQLDGGVPHFVIWPSQVILDSTSSCIVEPFQLHIEIPNNHHMEICDSHYRDLRSETAMPY